MIVKYRVVASSQDALRDHDNHFTIAAFTGHIFFYLDVILLKISRNVSGSGGSGRSISTPEVDRATTLKDICGICVKATPASRTSITADLP